MPTVEEELDCACLQFCIALLDHRLTGYIFDSAIGDFLAVLGIDTAREVLSGYSGAGIIVKGVEKKTGGRGQLVRVFTPA
jgi:hypothetical protein